MKAKLVISGRNGNIKQFLVTNRDMFRGSMRFVDFARMFEGESIRKIAELMYDIKIVCKKGE